jgi:hypothetical protein
MPKSTYLEILRAYSTNLELGEYSLSNAEALARGTLPIVVLMQEPCNLADSVPYNTMVYGDRNARKVSSKFKGSPALLEVEYLTELASYANYDLRDIHVFDINTLLSPKLQSESSELESDLRAAHSACWEMLKALKPKVILVLTTHANRSSVTGLQQLSSSLKKAGTTKTIEIKGREVRVIHGFHPSVYLRKDYASRQKWLPEDRELAHNVVRFCFNQAFEEWYNHSVDDTLLCRWRKLVGPKPKICPLEVGVVDSSLAEELEALGI